MLLGVAWTVLLMPECQNWLDGLPSGDRVGILQDSLLLQEFGPQLGRPHVDTMRDSKHLNMKELRSRHAGHQYRTLFAFDPNKRAILLIGGDKVGQDEGRFYKALIKRADAIYDRHLVQVAKNQARGRQGRKP
jgi:hypothetical protein